MAEPIDISFGFYSQVGQRKHYMQLNHPCAARCGLMSDHFDHSFLF